MSGSPGFTPLSRRPLVHLLREYSRSGKVDACVAHPDVAPRSPDSGDTSLETIPVPRRVILRSHSSQNSLHRQVFRRFTSSRLRVVTAVGTSLDRRRQGPEAFPSLLYVTTTRLRSPGPGRRVRPRPRRLPPGPEGREWSGLCMEPRRHVWVGVWCVRVGLGLRVDVL